MVENWGVQIEFFFEKKNENVCYHPSHRPRRPQWRTTRCHIDGRCIVRHIVCPIVDGLTIYILIDFLL